MFSHQMSLEALTYTESVRAAPRACVFQMSLEAFVYAESIRAAPRACVFQMSLKAFVCTESVRAAPKACERQGPYRYRTHLHSLPEGIYTSNERRGPDLYRLGP